MKITEIIKLIYIYLFSAIGLILIITGTVKLIDLGLKVYVFKQADVFYAPKIYPEINQGEKLTSEEIAKKKNKEKLMKLIEERKDKELLLALLIVGLPLFIYHWRLALKYYFNKE
jgi:hypothetical protein